MTNYEKHILVRKIISNQRFLQLKYISMSIDTVFDKSRKEDRYTHSVQVANACEIMNDFLSERVGFPIDYKNTAYITGLLHDIGHTAGGHEGEEVLDNLIKKYSNGKLFYEGNANNYIVIEKEGLLNDSKDKDYILASLAKHPKKLYKEQKHIYKMISDSIKEDVKYLAKNGMSSKNMEKTLQCQIMDIADENCYIISDVLDSRNLYNNYLLSVFFRKILPKREAENLIKNLYSSKKAFEEFLQELFIKFCSNYDLLNGELAVIDQDIESVRKGLMKFTRKFILGNKKILKSREFNSSKIKYVFESLMTGRINLPSKTYRNELIKSSSDYERLLVLRNALGSFTDKAINKLYKGLKNGKR